MIDIAAQSKKALEGISDVRLDLLRGHPGVKSGYHDYGNVDLGEKVHGHTGHGGDAHYRDNQTQHDDEIWISEGELGH